jgi:hypothetical protein
MKENRSIRFEPIDLEIADKLEIDINDVARMALKAEIFRRVSPEYKKEQAELAKRINRVLDKRGG